MMTSYPTLLLLLLLPLVGMGPEPKSAPQRVETTSAPNHTMPSQIPDPKMVFIKGGAFEMGSDSGENNERPVHEVIVSDFWLGQTEVTNEEYVVFLNAYGADVVKAGVYAGHRMIYEYERWGLVKTGREWKVIREKEKYPVVNVTWYGANEYCQWLSERTGQRWRLPTEAEWEYAAGGGSQGRTAYAGTNNGTELNEYAWYSGNSKAETHPVGMKKPNRLGLYDMSGNVWEWCEDWYGETYYQICFDEGTVLNPENTNPESSRRILRGGSWNYFALNCRASVRYWLDSAEWFVNNGFRIARD